MRFLGRKALMSLAFLEMLLMCGFQFSLLWMVTPRYLVLSTVFVGHCTNVYLCMLFNCMIMPVYRHLV